MQNPHSIAVPSACRAAGTSASGARSSACGEAKPSYLCLNHAGTAAIVTRTLVPLIRAEPCKNKFRGLGMEEIWVLAEVMAVIVGTFAVGMWIGHRIGQRNG